MNKRLLALGVLASALFVVPVTAAYAYGVVEIPDTATVDTPYPIEGHSLPTNDPVSIGVDGPGSASISPAAYVEVNVPVVGGSFSATVSFPEPGTYDVTVYQNEELIGSETVEVTALADDELGSTGFDATAIVWFGGGALALGTALIVTMAVVRRNAKLPTGV